MFVNYKSTLRFALLTPVLLIICVFLMGGGHGWYEASMILFPWGTLNTIWQDKLSLPFIIIGILQYPIYGFVIDKLRNSNYYKLTIIFITLLHVMLAIFIVLFKNNKWE